MTMCFRCFVSGRVQGVWFRGSTQRQAVALGITGYARNLPDGRVEVLACGGESALKSLKKWLWKGPPGARVADLVCSVVEEPAPTFFTTG